MTKTDILENLCYYDERNPDHMDITEYSKKEPCYCDNCFYGRHQLAAEILNLREVIQDYKDNEYEG